jgi:copper resistance protein D
VHLVASVGLVGGAALPLIAGRSDRPTAIAWQRRVGRASVVLAVVAIAAALAAVAHQTAVVTGRNAAALEPASMVVVLLDTHAGRVWLARLALLVLLGAFAGLTPVVATRKADWFAVRGEAVLLAGLALGLIAAAGHAAAVAPEVTGAVALGATGAVVLDAVHLLATGVWAGGLIPLAALLRAASHEGAADARPYAVLTARRFSRAALLCLLTLVASGVVNAVIQVGGVPALVGTPYGQLLLVKLTLVALIAGLGWINRRRWLPRLSGEAMTVGRPAMRDLGRYVGIEAALALGLLALVAIMSLTPPARHVDPAWPLSFRFTLAPLAGAPDLRLRALIGSQAMVLGLAVLLSAALIRRRRLVLAVGALTLVAFGAGLALPPISVDAYPTTYRRPAVTYQAASIVQGAALYQRHCAACHGSEGAGDGPARAARPRPPADLRAAHTGQHTAGDIFWWITAGIPAGGMPAFGAALGEEPRWDLVNFVRALGGAAAARRRGGGLAAPELVAPDFTFAVGPTPLKTLRDYRGQRIVALVLYTLPASRPRLAELARRYEDLVRSGVEVIAVPRDAAPDAIRRLGDEPRVLFPVVTDGAREIVGAYDLFVSSSHAELLIDRAGYLRALWTTPPQFAELSDDIARLNAEPLTTPASEHAH